jgi:hypothetical protein
MFIDKLSKLLERKEFLLININHSKYIINVDLLLMNDLSNTLQIYF